MRSGRKRWFFRLASAILVPLVLLGLLEGGLRVAGFGFPASFFLEAEREGKPVLIENARFGWLFFPRALARAPLPTVVPVVKPADACRIFVFGESAAKGEPEPAFGFPRHLQVLLESRFPGKRFEVVNVAVTAFNSHTVLPIARECARREGDFWVVYLGNNEVLGPYGAGSIFGARSPNVTLLRAGLALKRSRIGQLLDGLLSSLGSGDAVPETWGGMKMFLEQQFRQGDSRLEAVYRQFQANLEDILDAGSSSGAAVILSTMASNLQDCAPFGSLHSTGLTAVQLADWERRYQEGKAAEEAGRFAAAAEAFREAAEIDGSHAELRFRLARCLWADKRREEAVRDYTLARDLDTIRLRADTRTNDIIRATAARRTAQRVVLVDAERAFLAQSPHGLPGEESFHEHVHFNFQGNYRLARMFAAAIGEVLERTGAGRPVGDWPGVEECARRLAFTPWEEASVTEIVIKRLRKPPYNMQVNHAQRNRRLQERLEALRRAEKAMGFAAQEAIYQDALARSPEDWVLREIHATFLAVHGRERQAEEEYLQVIRLVPHHVTARYRLGVLHRDGPDFAAAERFFREALGLRPDFAEAREGLGVALARQGRHEAACAEFARALKLKPELLETHLHWAESLLALGKREEAAAQYRKLLDLRPNDPAALLGLKGLVGEEGSQSAGEGQAGGGEGKAPHDPPGVPASP